MTKKEKDPERIKKYIEDRTCLNVTCLNDQICAPKKTLSHFMQGRRSLPEHHIEPLVKELKRYGYK